MKNLIELLEIKDWLQLNAKLQQKKNTLRKLLKEKGILKKRGNNDYDNYAYFSEAQYKDLFTELFSQVGLELKFNELEYGLFEGNGKQLNGRMPKLEFALFDIETGFYELTTITSEGIDKGDKAGYKAFTGALKYYLADTFMVATGDDPEKESPETKMNDKKETTNDKKATTKQIDILSEYYKDENLKKLLEKNNIEKLEDIGMSKASELIKKIFSKKEN